MKRLKDVEASLLSASSKACKLCVVLHSMRKTGGCENV